MATPHVVVTGAAGFVGAHLVRRLRRMGHRVVGIDALRGTTTTQLAAERLRPLRGDPGFMLVELDLVEDDVGPLLDGAAAVFHLAGRPGARDDDRPALKRDNVDATRALLSAGDAHGRPHVIFASSSSVYGDAGARRASREGDALRPLSAYGETKQAAELLCRDAATRTTVVRMFTVYGPGQRADMAFARFIDAALDGCAAPLYQARTAARDFTYVGDAVDGLVLAWQRGVASVYNVSGGAVVGLGRAVATIEELTGHGVPTEAADALPQPTATHADLALTRADLGYAPRVDLRTGLAAQVAEAVRRRGAVAVA